jgi:hypothetical protein
MKKYKYVVVVGCSFSASDAVNLIDSGETYGDLIAKQLEAKLYNLSTSGGSFQRMNRKTLEWCSKNKDKFGDTLIILGITEPQRREVWDDKANRFLIYDEVPYKLCNDNAAFFLMTRNIIGLQSFLKVNNIDNVFFDALECIDTFWERVCDDKEDKLGYKLLFDSFVSQENWYKHPEYESMMDMTETNPDMRISEDDLHPNRKAHQYWGECLIKYINEKIL